MEIKVGGKYYAYGVEFSVKGVVEEWLFEINSRSDTEIYTRKVVPMATVSPLAPTRPTKRKSSLWASSARVLQRVTAFFLNTSSETVKASVQSVRSIAG